MITNITETIKNFLNSPFDPTLGLIVCITGLAILVPILIALDRDIKKTDDEDKKRRKIKEEDQVPESDPSEMTI